MNIIFDKTVGILNISYENYYCILEQLWAIEKGFA